MDLNIRNAVKSNLQNLSTNDIYQTIEDATKTEEENVLPGLGVLLEVLWASSTQEEKNMIVGKITNKLAN